MVSPVNRFFYCQWIVSGYFLSLLSLLLFHVLESLMSACISTLIPACISTLRFVCISTLTSACISIIAAFLYHQYIDICSYQHTYIRLLALLHTPSHPFIFLFILALGIMIWHHTSMIFYLLFTFLPQCKLWCSTKCQDRWKQLYPHQF